MSALTTIEGRAQLAIERSETEIANALQLLLHHPHRQSHRALIDDLDRVQRAQIACRRALTFYRERFADAE